jgi:preprotein translocase subunit SecA
MIANILAKIFGTKNERELTRLRPLVDQVGGLEASVADLTPEELIERTGALKERVERGESLDSILPEAFAAVREAGKRTLGERHYDEQLLGGAVLHSGKIAEMRTGEGKTLVATLPLYLNALTGRGAHLVTVNDYLARRDAEWMEPVYNALGMEVGVIQNSLDDAARKKAYGSDITYGTNNEFGFDYLRDNMKFSLNDYVQREHHFAIVDEVDSILIDEARTPLIISGPAEKGSDLYIVANKAVQGLVRDVDYELDEKAKSVMLTEDGTDKIEHELRVDNLYASENVLMLHHAQQALKANVIFRRDVDYMVRENEVLIVDEFTGRTLPGRRYSDGLHQALEAKEKVKVERENQTMAAITLQNYFRMYKKLSGMTGTAETEAVEFHKIYKLGVMVIPTHRPIARLDEQDLIFLSKEDKYEAVITDITACHERGQPVLVGTVSVEVSEYLGHLLAQRGIPHNVLNAKQHAREADVITEAGEAGRVTIATNMAGRGTDIKLGPGVIEAGGLRIIGTERHESRRIDNQLRGRAGRQGDPGSSRFYLSLDDDLIRIFAGDRIKRLMERFGMKKGESIEDNMVTKAIANAQDRVEKHNFDIRKHLLEYDDVMNQQRKVIYDYRREILDGADSDRELIKEVIIDITHGIFSLACPSRRCRDTEIEEVLERLSKLTGFEVSELQSQGFETGIVADFERGAVEFLCATYEKCRATIPAEMVHAAEKWLLLETVDYAWKIHLQNLDHLKEGIGLRGYGQKNPLLEYKKEAFQAFKLMMGQIKWDIAHRVFKMRPADVSAESIDKIEQTHKKDLDAIQVGGDTSDPAGKTVRRGEEKVGRNSPCSCGSGKKFKHCCGR